MIDIATIREAALMVNTDEIARLIGGTAYDSSGDKVGKIGMVYLDDQTNEPDWVTVNTGFFGSNESFVPLEGAVTDGDSLRLAYTADQIKDAPTIDADAHLDVEQEAELDQHYGRSLPPAGPHPDHRADDSTESEKSTMTAHQDQSADQHDHDVDTDVVEGTAAGEEIAEGIIEAEETSATDQERSSAEGGSDVNLRGTEDSADHRRD